MYNYDCLNKYKEVYLVEGIADALTIGDNAVASLGWSLSTKQIAKIYATRAEKITLVPDRGFYKKSLQTALKLGKTKKVRVLNFDKIPEKLGKDVNETGLKIVMKHIKKIKYLEYQDIIKQLCK